MPAYKPVKQRLMEKVEVQPCGCWLFRGSKAPGGYGVIKRERSAGNALAHVVSYEVFNGPIADGMVVMHSCDTPPCVNPAHLSLGTHEENMADMKAKGRGSVPKTWARPNRYLTDSQKAAIVSDIRNGDPLLRIATRHQVDRTVVRRLRDESPQPVSFADA